MARSEDADARAARWEREAHDLSTQVAFLQEELALVRRKLTENPRHVRQLEDRIAATQAQLARLTENNERLVATLKEARSQIVTLKEEVDRLAQPPSGYGVFMSRHEDGTVDVFTGGRKLRVAGSPAVDSAALRKGQEVLLNDALNIVAALGFERAGEVVMLKEVLEGGDRALVISHADEERIVLFSRHLLDSPLRAGDFLLSRSGRPTPMSTSPRAGRGARPGGARYRLSRHRGPGRQIGRPRRGGLPFLHPAVPGHQLRRRRACCSTARPAAARQPILGRWPTPWPEITELKGGERAPTTLSIKGPELLHKHVERPSGTSG